MIRLPLILGSFLLLLAQKAQGEDQLVIKKETKILKAPEKNSPSAGTANKGDILPLVSKERKGLYWQTQKGFVYMLDGQVKTKENSENSMASSIQKDQNNQKESPRARSAVMGVRGLNDNQKDSSQIGNVTPDIKAVHSMEKNLNHAIKSGDIDQK